MHKTRLSSGWKKIMASLSKCAIRAEDYLRAPEDEQPDAIIDKDYVDNLRSIKSEPEPSEEDEIEGVPEGMEPYDYSSDKPYKQTKEDFQNYSPSVEDSLLLDESEKERAQMMFDKFDPEFLREDKTIPERELQQLNRDEVLIKREHSQLDREEREARRILETELKRIKARPSYVSKYLADLDEARKKIKQLEKKYGPEAIAKMKKEEMADLSTGESRVEKRENSEVQLPPSEYQTMDEESASRMNSELEESSGLAESLINKTNSDLSDVERGQLLYILRSFDKLLRRPELGGSLEHERKMVRLIMTTMRKLTDKFSDAINQDLQMKREILDLQESTEKAEEDVNRHSEGSATYSNLKNWHGNDPIKIAIAARIIKNAGKGGSSADRMLGKERDPLHGYNPLMQDISTGTSTFRADTAIERLLTTGEASEIMDRAISEALDTGIAQDSSKEHEARKIFEAAAAEAYVKVEEEYLSMHSGDSPYEGSIGEDRYIEDTETGEEIAQKSKPAADYSEKFVSDYIKVADSVLDIAIANSDKLTSVSPEPVDTILEEQKVGEPVPETINNPETGELEMTPETLSDINIRQVTEDTGRPETTGVNLNRGDLYYSDGTLRDIKQLYVDADENQRPSLWNLLKEEQERLNDTPDSEDEKKNADRKETLGYIDDSLDQLSRMMTGKFNTTVNKNSTLPSLDSLMDKIKDMSSPESIMRAMKAKDSKILDGLTIEINRAWDAANAEQEREIKRAKDILADENSSDEDMDEVGRAANRVLTDSPKLQKDVKRMWEIYTKLENDPRGATDKLFGGDDKRYADYLASLYEGVANAERQLEKWEQHILEQKGIARAHATSGKGSGATSGDSEL